MSILDTVLNLEPVSRVRRNHGLEHATLHVLSARYPRKPMAGHSDSGGFWILGDVSTDDVRSAVDQALARMQSGEESLAVHPNCGTNFVTSGVLAGLAAWVALAGSGKGWRSRLERLPTAMALATLALVFGQPLGFLVQTRVTTSGRPEGLRVISIHATRRSGMPAHRVLTEG